MGHFGLKSPTNGAKWGYFKKYVQFTQFGYKNEVRAKFQVTRRIFKLWITQNSSFS